MIPLRRRCLSALLAVLIMGSATIYLSPPAMASESEDAALDTVEDVEEALDEVLESVAPEVLELVDETRTDVSQLEIDITADEVVEFESEDGDLAVAIPKDGTDGVLLEYEGEDEDSDATIEIGMPGDGEDAAVTEDGSVVYEEIANDSDLVVEALDNGGVRMMVVIDGADAPTDYAFDLDIPDDAELRLNDDDGSVSVIDSDGETVGVFSTPWAYDANGASVPTHYTIEGDTLIQTVLHEGFTYPVVADPSWWWWTKNIAWCAAGIGTLAASYSVKTALVVSKISQIARNNQRFRIAMYNLGGAATALKTLLQVIAKKVPVLNKIVGSTASSYKMAQLGALAKEGLKWIVIGLIGGSCWDIGAEISPYW